MVHTQKCLGTISGSVLKINPNSADGIGFRDLSDPSSSIKFLMDIWIITIFWLLWIITQYIFITNLHMNILLNFSLENFCEKISVSYCVI